MKATVSEENTFLDMLADAMSPMPLRPLFALCKTTRGSLKCEETDENDLMGHTVCRNLHIFRFVYVSGGWLKTTCVKQLTN